MRGERDIKLATAENLAEYLGLELTPQKPTTRKIRQAKRRAE